MSWREMPGNSDEEWWAFSQWREDHAEHDPREWQDDFDDPSSED